MYPLSLLSAAALPRSNSSSTRVSGSVLLLLAACIASIFDRRTCTAVEYTEYTVHDIADEQALRSASEATKELVVYFYATWCNHCSTFGPVFDRSAAKVARPGILDFVRFNGGANRNFAGPLIGDIYPAVALYRDGEFYMHAQLETTSEGLEDWLYQFTGDPVKVVSTKSEAISRAQKGRTAFVIEYSTRDQETAKKLFSMARDRRHYGNFFGVPSSAREVESASIFNVTVYHEHEDPVSIIPKRDDSDDETFSVPAMSVEDVFNWCDEHRFPLLGKVDASNQYLYYMRGKNPVMIFATSEQMEQEGPEWRQLAKAFSDLSFMWLNTDKESLAARTLGLTAADFPAFVSFTGTGEAPRKRKKYYLRNVTLGSSEKSGGSSKPNHVATWLSSVTTGRLRPSILSTNAAPPDRSFRLRNVKWVTGDAFEQIVDPSPANDFLLLLTGPKGTDLFPGCRTCEPVLQMADKLLKELPDMPLHIGELLVTANEIPFAGDQWVGTWELTDLPVGYFVPAVLSDGSQQLPPLSQLPVSEWKKLEVNPERLLQQWLRDTQLFKAEATAALQQLQQANSVAETSTSPRDEL